MDSRRTWLFALILRVVPQHSNPYVNDYRTTTIDPTVPEPPSVKVQLALKTLETVAGT